MRRTSIAALLSATVLTVGVAVVPFAQAAPGGQKPFPETIALPDGFQPEGIESDGGTTLYVGSLVDGAIWTGDARTGESSLLVDGVAGQVAVGLEYDARNDRLWVAGGATGQVRVYDAGSGDLLATYDAPGATGFLNDVAVTPDAVYVTDSNLQQVLVVPTPGGDLGDAAQLVPITGDLVYGAGFNANGIVEVQGSLLVVQSSTGLLFRLGADGSTTQVDLGGQTLVNGDGMYVRGRTLYVVQNALDTITEVRLGAGLASGTVVRSLTDDDLDVPATVTVAAGRLYAVNARFSTPATPDTSYDVVLVPTTGRG